MIWLPWLPHLTFDSPRRTGSGFAFTSEVWNCAFLKLDYKVRYRVHLQRHDLPGEFYENIQIGEK
jgi:hypothetical protein